MSKIYGVDMALSHFAIVDSDGNIICAEANTNTMDSSPDDLMLVAERVVRYLPHGAIVNIDWDVNIGSFGSKKPGSKKFNNPKVGVIITTQIMLFAGMAYMKKRIDVKFITPGALRKCLGLPLLCPKQTVHESYWDVLPDTVKSNRSHPIKQVRGDIIDAYLLTYVSDCARNK